MPRPPASSPAWSSNDAAAWRPRRRRRRTGNGTRLGRSIFRLHRRLQIHVAEVVRVATLSEPDAGNGQNGGGGSGEKKEVPGLPGRVKGGPGDTDG